MEEPSIQPWSVYLGSVNSITKLSQHYVLLLLLLLLGSVPPLRQVQRRPAPPLHGSADLQPVQRILLAERVRPLLGFAPERLLHLPRDCSHAPWSVSPGNGPGGETAPPRGVLPGDGAGTPGRGNTAVCNVFSRPRTKFVKQVGFQTVRKCKDKTNAYPDHQFCVLHWEEVITKRTPREHLMRL